MKWIIGAVLGCAIAASPLVARQEPDDKDKPKQQEPKPKQEEPKPKQQEPKQQPQEKPKTNSDNRQQEPNKQQKADEKQQQKEQRDTQGQAKESEKQNKDAEGARRDNRQQPQGNAQQTDRGQRSGQESRGGGQRIPQERYQANFGREHHFRVSHVDDRHRFQYSGYWFEVVQPWPAGWSYSDDCYIEEDDGQYYLVDLIHPEIRVLVTVVVA